MSTFTEYPIPKPATQVATWNKFIEFAAQIHRHLTQFLRGKLNVGGEFTIANTTGKTTVSDSRLSKTSCIVLQPLDAVSAARLQYVYVDTADYTTGRTDTQTVGHIGSFVVRHDSNVADSDFRYLILG